MRTTIRSGSTVQSDTCKRCGAQLVRNPDQAQLCSGCAPPAAARAILKALSAVLSSRPPKARVRGAA